MDAFRKSFCAYLAPEGFEELVANELKDVFLVHGRLFLAAGPRQESVWSANVWLKPEVSTIASIGDAAKRLAERQRNWWPYLVSHHRRGELIQKKLPYVSGKPLNFPTMAPRAPLGSWTLLDETTLLASTACTSPFPNGEVRFVEDRDGPPSRAYLKLWEAFTRFGRSPKSGETCLELGAAPGGWTYVLAQSGARVIAVDRAPLAPQVAAFANVESSQGDAFKVTPASLGPVDWVLSDIICYPKKMYEYLQLWLAVQPSPNILVTVKFQGEEHYGAIADFKSIEGGELVHLFHNKHELTFAWLRP